MKVSDAPTKIAGVQLGEATLNLIDPSQPPIKAKFALVSKTGDVCGSFLIQNGWAPKTLEALQKFCESLEEEAFFRVFEVPDNSSTSDQPKVDLPPQF